MSTDCFASQEYYRAREGAKLLRIGLSTFWRWVQQGRIPEGKKIGARVTVWRREDLLTLAEGGAE